MSDRRNETASTLCRCGHEQTWHKHDSGACRRFACSCTAFNRQRLELTPCRDRARAAQDGR